jgi:PAS domain S-box-containing protein
MLNAGKKSVPMSQIIHYHQILAKEPYFSTIARDISERLVYEEELAQAYAYTRTLIEMSLDPLFTISSDGRIQDVNHATELATGFRRNHLIRTFFKKYFHEPDIAQAGFEMAISGELIKEYPADILHRSGQITPVWLNASAYRDDSGAIQGVFITARETGELYPGRVLLDIEDIQGKPPPRRRRA